MSTYTEVVKGEVCISGYASDVAWEGLRMIGHVENMLDEGHINRCYRHLRIWKEYVEKFNSRRRVTLNLTQVIWANRHEQKPWYPNDPPDWDQEIVTVKVTGYDRKKYR